MRSLAALAVASLVLAAPTVARAQATPEWAGLFVQDDVRVRLVPTSGGFIIRLEVGARGFDGRGTVEPEGALAGTFVADGVDFDFTARLDGKDTLVLESEGSKRRLPRCKPTNPLVGQPTVVAREAPRGGLVAHLRAGQRFHYRMMGGVEMVWTVKEVRPDRVRYETQSYMDMGQGLQPVGDPTPSEFPLAPAPPANGPQQQQVPDGTKVRRERVTIGGIEFDCMVCTTGDTESWITMVGESPTFPGVVRSSQGGEMVMELVRIDQP